GGHDCASTGTSPFDVIVYILPFLAIIVLRHPDPSPQRGRGIPRLVIITVLISGAVIASILMETRQTHAQATGEQVYYYHLDHLGTPIMMTDASQNVVWQASYDPFGAATINTATISNNLRFPGMYSDTETGLYYNINRYYYPSIGRYIEPDPILQPIIDVQLSIGTTLRKLLPVFIFAPQLLHGYVYAINNSVNFFDMDGLDVISEEGGPPPGLNGGGGIVGGGEGEGIAAPPGGGSIPIVPPIPIVPAKPRDKCNNCPPCDPPVGTIAYRQDPGVAHGIIGYGSHVHLYKMNQNPNDYSCHWNKAGVIPPPPPPGAIPMP
ncbi:MAG: RHS domain-containing protein, partial [Deltaproteobacteria bacterium]|nr:RHS domain-containing protein [Deltaproteobacteria bacterium]